MGLPSLAEQEEGDAADCCMQASKRPAQKAVGTAKKWQRMFRYTAEREKALKGLVEFVHLVHVLAQRSVYSPESIRDNKGGKIYL